MLKAADDPPYPSLVLKAADDPPYPSVVLKAGCVSASASVVLRARQSGMSVQGRTCCIVSLFASGSAVETDIFGVCPSEI